MTKLLAFLATSALAFVAAHASAATHGIYGSGHLTGQTNSYVNSTYDYRGEGDLVGNDFTYTLDLRILNVLGETHHFTSGTFDITTGLGTQVLDSCTGSKAVCGSQEDFIGVILPFDNSDSLDANNLDNITWEQIVVEDLGLAGLGDSYSEFTATTGPVPELEPVGGCAYNPRGSYDMLIMLLLACSIFYSYSRKVIQ